MPKTAFTATIVTPTANDESGVKLDDFYAYMRLANAFFFAPCRDLWPGTNIDRRLPRVPVLTKSGKPKRDKNGDPIFEAPSKWLTKNRPVETATWLPGLPVLIPNRLMTTNGWIDRKNVTCFNLYRAPQIKLGDAAKAQQWLDHANKVFNADDADHIIKWLAHRVQRPSEKINHALLLGGAQGIGKDSLLEPVKQAIGAWNFHDISPEHLTGTFNDFLKSVILRASEGRDLGEINRFKFYDHLKIYTAAPPDVLRVNEKHIREYYVPNILGLIITTNHKTDGLYLPEDDRRHYFAWSDRQEKDFTREYWNELWNYYAKGGIEHVAAYLTELDISDFDPKAPPPKTAAFWQVVSAGHAPEDAEVADAIDVLGNPDALTVKQLTEKATGSFVDWLLERKNRRAFPYRFERCGYVSVRNPDAKDGLWKLKGERQVIYAKASLTPAEAIEAGRKLVRDKG